MFYHFKQTIKPIEFIRSRRIIKNSGELLDFEVLVVWEVHNFIFK